MWIKGGFCESNNGESNSYIDGKICINNVKWFDKYSKYPYSYHIISNTKNRRII
jgi:hypothetical protein